LTYRAKTATGAKLMGQFCSFFFLGGQNRNFLKLRGLKLLLNLKSNMWEILEDKNKNNIVDCWNSATINMQVNES